MFRIMEENAQPVLYWEDAILFMAESAVLYDEEGFETLALSGFNREEDGASVQFRGERGEAVLRFRMREGSVLLDTQAALFEREPVFGAQRFFPRRCAAEFILRFAKTGSCLSLYQHKDWWMRPDFTSGADRLPARTQMAMLRLNERFFSLITPCGLDTRADLEGMEGEKVCLRISSNRFGCRVCRGPLLAVSSGTDPHACAGQAVRTALPPAGRLRKEKAYPDVFEGLGWCSWDAYYHKVSADGLFRKARELREKGVCVKWFLIDDGWLDVTDQKLNSFQASKEKFPEGLGAAVRRLKEEYGVERVGVWHTLSGYWNGIHPQSPLAKSMRDCLYENARGVLVPCPQREKAAAFFGAFYRELAQCGIDFAKVDGQSSLANHLAGDFSFGRASRETLSGLEDAANRYFNGAVIHCMGMAPQEIWNRGGMAVSRTSDDYVPQQEDGFAEHAFQNAYASLWHGFLYWGDWDMFWSKHPQAKQHAILHAVGGGPVYLSDPEGETDPALLKPLLLEDGTLLRCDAPAVPARDCLFADPRKTGGALKLLNGCAGGGVAAAFHVGEKGTQAQYCLSLEDYLPGNCACCAVYNCLDGSAFLLKKGERRSFALGGNETAVYCMASLRGGFACFGLAGKYLPRAAILSENTEITEDGVRIERIRLRAGGRLVFFAAEPPRSVLANGAPVSWQPVGEGLYEADLPQGGGETEACVLLRIPLILESEDV